MHKLIDAFTRLLREMLRAESHGAGRINALGMVLGALIVIALSLTPPLEALVRIIRPDAQLGVPIVQILLSFFLFTLLCAILMTYVERAE